MNGSGADAFGVLAVDLHVFRGNCCHDKGGWSW